VSSAALVVARVDLPGQVNVVEDRRSAAPHGSLGRSWRRVRERDRLGDCPLSATSTRDAPLPRGCFAIPTGDEARARKRKETRGCPESVTFPAVGKTITASHALSQRNFFLDRRS